MMKGYKISITLQFRGKKKGDKILSM